MEVFNRVLCKENIKLEPKFLNKYFALEVKRRLIEKVEGKNTKHGYIKHDSVEIYKTTPGTVELITLAGHVVYTVYFYADVCNPVLGSIIKATISNINRFGILADSGYNYLKKGTFISVLEIIIAKNSVNIQSDVDLELLKIGDEVKIEIIGKKFKLGEFKITAIGRIVKEKESNKSQNKKQEVIVGDNEEGEEEEAYEEKSDVEADEEEEEEEEDEEEAEDDDLEEEEEEKHGGSDFFSDEETFFSEEADDEFDDERDDGDDGDDKDLSDFDDTED